MWSGKETLRRESDSARAHSTPSEGRQQQPPTAGGGKKSVYMKIQPATRQTADDDKKLVRGWGVPAPEVLQKTVSFNNNNNKTWDKKQETVTHTKENVQCLWEWPDVRFSEGFIVVTHTLNRRKPCLMQLSVTVFHQMENISKEVITTKWKFWNWKVQ